MTAYETEVDTIEATQEASAGVLSDVSLLEAGDLDNGTPLFVAPVLDRIRTCD